MLLHEKLKPFNLILASASPRRKQLLTNSGLKFTVADKFNCSEEFSDKLAVEDVATHLALRKSHTYPKALQQNDILLTADTVVIVDNTILGKPANREEAIKMLCMLSGRTHSVITGVALRMTDRTHFFSVSSSVSFRELSKEEIAYYIDTFKPYDKAGAYGIQEWIGYVAIESIEGSFFNVMGLPIQCLYVELEKFIDRYLVLSK